jgi:hypothetical protein
MNDTYTRILAMMVGVVVKPAYGGSEVEAQYQLAIWIAAGLKSRRLLTVDAIGDISGMDNIPLFGWTVVGPRWELYFGLVNDSETGKVVSSCAILTISFGAYRY